MPKRALLLSLLSLALALGACKSKGIHAPEKLAPLSEAEATEFAARLTLALNMCDQKALEVMIDVDSMMRTAVRNRGALGNVQKKLLATLRANAEELRAPLCAGSRSSDKFQFLRVRSRSGKQSLLYRAISEETLNYLEFHAGKSADGNIIVNNVFVYLNGQTLVETLEQMIDDDRAIIAAFNALGNKMTTDPKGALAELAALPKSVQESKPLQILRIQAASSQDDTTYEAAVSDYERLFPGDPGLHLVSINSYVLRKSYQAALQTIDELDAHLEGDPQLDGMRVSILLEEGKDLTRATALAEKLVQASPESEDAHYLLLGAHVDSHNFAGAVAIMQLMGERFDLVFESKGLAPGDPNYMALKDSPEWEAYLAKLGPK